MECTEGGGGSPALMYILKIVPRYIPFSPTDKLYLYQTILSSYPTNINIHSVIATVSITLIQKELNIYVIYMNAHKNISHAYNI